MKFLLIFFLISINFRMNNPPRDLPKNIKIYDRSSLQSRLQGSILDNSEFPIYSLNIPNSVGNELPIHTIISKHVQPNQQNFFKTIPSNIKTKAKKYIFPLAKKLKRLEKNIHSTSQTLLRNSLKIDKNQEEENFERPENLYSEKAQEEGDENKVCKICIDETENEKTGKLISPCKCAGSMKFIHVECLKTWLVAKNQNIPSASCEICHKNYLMEFEYGWKFQCKQAFREGLLSFILSIFLFFMIVGIILMIVIFFNKM